MVVHGLIIALTVTLALALGGFIAALVALARLNALEARIAELAEIVNGIDRPVRVSLPAEEWRGSIGVGWGRPRLVASRRDGMFNGGA